MPREHRRRLISIDPRLDTLACVADSEVIPRRAGRVLLVDADGRVLLLQGFNPAAPGELFWFTIGGGVDDGESTAEAAARELREEAGLTIEPGELGSPVWQRVARFGFDGRRYQQEEEYFLVRTGAVEVSLAGLDEIEQETIVGYRWWNAAELESARERFYPQELPQLLRDLTT